MKKIMDDPTELAFGEWLDAMLLNVQYYSSKQGMQHVCPKSHTSLGKMPHSLALPKLGR